ncbi:MAG: helix-turn-helix domain-containing protein, partial [Oscillospiraceae bacterium]|nr:helix-turn-helix domain-containing protein [Oscillospiraceae bacterium]
RGLSWDNLERLCRMLDCDISDFLEFEKENTEEHK